MKDIDVMESWNVYAWHKNRPAIKVGEHLSFAQASAMVNAYLNRGLEWDAYQVQVYDDPGETSNAEAMEYMASLNVL